MIKQCVIDEVTTRGVCQRGLGGEITYNKKIGPTHAQLVRIIQRRGYRTVSQGPNEQPHIIDLYFAPDYSVDSPITTLPMWFRHLLTSPGGDFHLLQTTVAETDDWGLAREITQYRQIDDNITHLTVKVKEYQLDLEAVQANLTSCESHLMFARAAERVKTLCNVLRKMTAV